MSKNTILIVDDEPTQCKVLGKFVSDLGYNHLVVTSGMEVVDFFMNKKVYESLPKDLQVIMDTVMYRAHIWVLSEFEMQNALYLPKILSESKTQLKAYPKEVLDKLREYTKEAIEEAIGDDPLSKKVYESYRKYAKTASDWAKLTEKAYYDRIQG